jgi:beta-glucosidase/6-phospho-beta-glucosidase/beta-galactosidase
MLVTPLLLMLQIKHWVTINEPASICDHGYKNGIYAPGVKGDKTALYK